MVDPVLMPCECEHCTRKPRRTPVTLMIGVVGLFAWAMPSMQAIVEGWVR